MRPHRAVLVVAALSIVVAGAALLGCSQSTSPTSPSGGGSTGGSGSANTPFNSGSLNASAQFIRVFPTAGTVGYHCNFHVAMGMTGTVTVAAGEADSAVVTAGGTSFTPQTVRIKPGGYVHWKLTDGPHTITSN